MTVLPPEAAASRCQRCDGELWLQLKTTTAGDPPTVRVLPLCPRCDAGDEASQGLLAFFAVHGAVSPDNVDTFATLAAEWISRLPSPRLYASALAAVCEALHGYFDDDL